MAVIGLLAACVGAAPATAPAPAFLTKLAAAPPCAPLALAARTNGIPLDRIDPFTEGTNLNPGDSVTAVVTLRQRNSPRLQWLVHLVVAAPAAGERPAAPPPPMVLFTSFGAKLEYASSPAFATVRTLGPFGDGEPGRRTPKPGDTTARVRVNESLLGVGLERAAAVALRLKTTMAKGTFALQGKPFDDAQVRAGQAVRDRLQITPEDERALGGMAPAMTSYFSLTQQTPGLSDILVKILDLPSVWSLVRNRGVNQVHFAAQKEHLGPADPAAWGLPADVPVYYHPVALELDGHRALDLMLVVTTPRPPLLACGGIVGLLAEKPGDREDYLSLRVVSARRTPVPGQAKE